MHRSWLLFVFIVSSAAILGGPQQAEGAPLDAATRDFDQLHLEIDVTPDLQAGTVDGEVKVVFSALGPRLRRLRLHCEDTQVLGVKDDTGRPLAYDHQGGVLSIDLGRDFGRGDTSDVTVRYRSTPKRGLYFHRPSDRHPKTPLFLYSQGQSNDNRRWIPCYDLPDDRCTWSLKVTVPEKLSTVSNGTLKSSATTEDGLRTDRWNFESRSPSYLITLIVAPLETVTDTWNDVTLEYSAVPGYTEELRTSLGQTPRMMEFFSTYLEHSYPWPRYAQTYVWDFVYGGMENTTATTLNMRALHRAAARPNYQSEPLVAHELAHMWFGDLLTCRTWDDIWLNEGFATYLTDLYYEHRDGTEAFQLRRRQQNESYMNGTPNAANLGLEPHPRGDRPLELFGGKQYNRGAAILHMLRLELGDEVFRKGIAHYVDTHEDHTVASEDLRHAVEEVAGRNLGWFWDQWVYGCGYPVLEVRNQRGILKIRQKQECSHGQHLFRFTLPVRFGTDGEVHRLRIFRKDHEFDLRDEIASQSDPDSFLRVGVGGDMLLRVEFDQPREAWAAALAGDPDMTGRLDAVEALIGRGDDAVPALAAALEADGSWAVRQAAASALGQMDDSPAAGQALLGAVEDEDPRVRETVFEALGRRSRAEAGEAVAAALTTETHDYPLAAAARAAGLLEIQDAFGKLRELLGRPSHGDVVTSRALEGLMHLGDDRGAELARTYCEYAWGKGGAHRMRSQALETVTALAPDAPETHRLLVTLLDDPYHRMRAQAAKACGTYGVTGARRRLQQLQQGDWDGGVRNAAKQALDRLK